MPSKTTAAAKIAAPAPTAQRASLVRKMAAKYGLEDAKLMDTLKATAFRQTKKEGGLVEVTNEQMAALLVVADQYGLNPFTREIYAFPDKGGIVPIVSVDGWIRIINERPELQSIHFDYAPEDTAPEDQWIGCTITRSDRTRPIEIREYFKECYRDTTPWNSHPRRMLRHKALIQCGRVAFGFAGIYDPDEAQRIAEANALDSTATEVSAKAGTTAPRAIEHQSTPAEKTSTIEGNEIKPKLSEGQAKYIEKVLDNNGVPLSALLAHYEIGDVQELAFDAYDDIMQWIAETARGE